MIPRASPRPSPRRPARRSSPIKGDLATITDPLGKVTTRFTDPGGRLISVTSPLGHRTRYEWNPLNQLTKTIDPLNGATQLTYDPNGNLTGVRDAKNNLIQFVSDSMDRSLRRTDALGHTANVLLHDENGNPGRCATARGQVTQTIFDPLNRPKVITWADASTTTLTWDAGNRLIHVVDSISGTIARNWDELDRPTLRADAAGSDRLHLRQRGAPANHDRARPTERDL